MAAVDSFGLMGFGKVMVSAILTRPTDLGQAEFYEAWPVLEVSVSLMVSWSHILSGETNFQASLALSGFS